ncbi:MAG: HIT domain-containing protein [Bacteroidetes bacterium]|nr:HIT domain-containing protein [Bacteroidota bacterium]
MDCIFCSIIAKEIESSFVYEDDLVIGIMDLFPATEGHVLVIPKVHSELITGLDDVYVERMFKAGKYISAAMRKSRFTLDAVSFVLSDGKSAGQEIPHAHLHLIPRYSGDGIGFRFGSKHKFTREHLDKTAKEIKSGIEI